MRKFFILLLGAVVLLDSRVLLAQNSYNDQIKAMNDVAQGLKSSLETNALNFSGYDKWYKSFSPLAEQFVKSFSMTDKEKKSFQLIREAHDRLSLAWTTLKQAEYAEDQYRDFITAGDAGYAHKWREDASNKKKEAQEAVTNALSLLAQAQSAMESGG
jgi:hypothetical protein